MTDILRQTRWEQVTNHNPLSLTYSPIGGLYLSRLLICNAICDQVIVTFILFSVHIF